MVMEVVMVCDGGEEGGNEMTVMVVTWLL